jgi:uncharacterized protein
MMVPGPGSAPQATRPDIARGAWLRACTSLAVAAAAVTAVTTAPLHAQLPTDSYVILMGQDTFAVETFTRTADRIEGELAGPAVGRMVYTAVLGPDALFTEVRLKAWMPGTSGDAAPAQEARLTLQGDSVIAEITGAAGSVTQRIASQPGALLYLNPSFALMEQLLRSVRQAGGADATVPLFMVQGGTTLPTAVTWPTPDSAVITMGGQQMRTRVREDGRLVSGGVAAQGLSFTLVEGVAVPPPAVEPPDYSAPADAPYTAEEVLVRTPAGHTLAGTLTRPAGAAVVPAVVTITGSGSQDRDQAIPLVRGYRPFRQIADTLSRRGIAVLRLDDRGFGASTGEFAAATSADFADDIRAAVAFLRDRPDIDGRRIALVGHSEGGMIAPMVAASDTALAGIVIIAGPSRSGREIIEYQQRYAIESSAGIPAAARDSVLAAAATQLEEAAARQPWLRFFLDHDPLPAARKVSAPVLILHGATDRQVTEDQAHELAREIRLAGNPDVALHVLPGINHLLLPDEDGNPAGYTALPDRAVAPAVLGLLADWLAQRLH